MLSNHNTNKVFFIIAIVSLFFLSKVKTLDEDTVLKQEIYHVDPEDKSYRIGNARYNDKTRSILTIYDVGYLTKGGDPKDMGDEFLKNNRNLLRFDRHFQSESWEITSIRKTGVWTTVRYRQMYENVPVYDADIAITINEENVVRMVSSNYKRGVRIDPSALQPRLRDGGAQNVASSKYAKGQFSNFKYYSNEMVLYHEGKGKTRLAWKVRFSINGEMKDIEVVVDDKTGDVILEIDRTLDKKGGLVLPKSNIYSGKDEITSEIGNHTNTKKSKLSKQKTLRNGENTESRWLQFSNLYTISSSMFHSLLHRFLLIITFGSCTQLPSLSPSSTPSTSFPTAFPSVSSSIIPSKSPSLLPTDDALGYIFDPDPISTSGAGFCDEGFCDNNDEDSNALSSELKEVRLKDITEINGTFYLSGPYAQIVDEESPFDGIFENNQSNDFRYTRGQNGFEAVMCYYHLDKMMRYINKTLKLDIWPHQYRGGIKYDPHAANGEDNSYYVGHTGVLYFGQGFVDDAEDADVIIHELGHAIHDFVSVGGLSQKDGLSEGFADYLASSYSRSKELFKRNEEKFYWVFPWDGHNSIFGGWAGRTTNYDKKYPNGLVNQIHSDGQIWSTCNMRVYDAIGRFKSDRAHLVGLSATTSGSNQEDVANAILLAAQDLGYSFDELSNIYSIYEQCGYEMIQTDKCGDGVLGIAEECDGDRFTSTCQNVGCHGGKPKCTSNCKIDYSTCTADPESQIKFELNITFDDYPEENTWRILDINADVVTSGGDYGDIGSETFTESRCLLKDECYLFEMMDEGGDGMCCRYGEGGYSLEAGSIVMSDMNFQTRISVQAFGSCYYD